MRLGSMADRRLEPPDDLAPTSAWAGEGVQLELPPLAQEICRRYRLEFPDEPQRYGSAVDAWCVHDTQHLLNWAAEAVGGYVDLTTEIGWLASVLEARGFPIERLARNLDIAADVVLEAVHGAFGRELGHELASAAAFVRSRGTFLPVT